MVQPHEFVIRRSWGALFAWFGPFLGIFGVLAVLNLVTFGSDDPVGSGLWVGAILVLRRPAPAVELGWVDFPART